MGDTTSIAWADCTLNPWIGCSKVSTGPLGGCEGCYAEARDIRFDKGAHWGPGAPRRRTSVSNWKKPFTWDRKVRETGYRPRVMCGSLCDVFDNEIPMAWRNDLWMTIRNTPDLRWMLITKRIGNVPDMLPEDWTDVGAFAHVGIIATMVTQDEIDRDVSKLVSVPSAWWGISVEPQLGAIVLPSKLTNHAARFPGRVWIISGGESYQPQIHDSRADVRGYDLKWAFSLKAQCALAGIAYFQKQLGARPHVAGVPYACALDPDAGANINDWPVPLRVQEFPGPLK